MMALPSARRSKEIYRAFLQGWAVRTVPEPSDLCWDESQSYGHGCLPIKHSRQRNKAMDPGHLLLTSQTSPPLTLPVRSQNTLLANLRTHTTETLSLSDIREVQGCHCWECRATKKTAGFPLLTPPPYNSIGLQITAPGCHEFGAPLLSSFLCRVGPLK